MNSYETIENFLSINKWGQSAKQKKRKVLMELCNYIESNQQLKDDWDFRSAKKIVYKERELYLPLDELLLLDFIAKKSPSLKDWAYNDYVTTLVQFGHYLFRRKILIENPSLVIPKRSRKSNNMSDKCLSFDESMRLLEAAYFYDKQHRVRNFTLVLMLLTIAIRPGVEICNLTEDKIKFELSLLFAQGKTGWRRGILTQGVEETIKVFLEDPERLKAVANFDKRYLFYSDKGTQLNTYEMNKLLKAFAKKAGLSKNITAYWLRRTFGTILANSEFCLMEIKKIFDHDRITSTEHYVLNTKNDIRHLVEESSICEMLTDLARDKLELV